MSKTNRINIDVMQQKALLLKALSHPVRLCVAKELLEKGESNVSAIQHCLDLSQSSVSQHLGRLRDMGIIHGERKGLEVYYRLISPDAMAIIRALFFEDDHF